MVAEPFNISRDGMEDWPKETLDLDATNVQELREELDAIGVDVEVFKSRPAYWAALDSGRYPWLVYL